MEDTLQNDPEYLKTVLFVTREKLANAIFTVTELEARIAMEQQRNQELQQKLDSTKKEN
jgi:BMFP domain-containing protein YqiC